MPSMWSRLGWRGQGLECFHGSTQHDAAGQSEASPHLATQADRETAKERYGVLKPIPPFKA